MYNTISLEQQLDHHKVLPKFLKIRTGNSKFKINLSFSKQNVFPVFDQEESTKHDTLWQDDNVKVKDCISQIADPLWKDICMNLLSIMGPISVLKIWESKLGEFSSQDKHIDITCKTEESAAFAQQYNFVILGSLQRYFPALKQLRVKRTTRSSISCSFDKKIHYNQKFY
jgi:hypothetical protein